MSGRPPLFRRFEDFPKPQFGDKAQPHDPRDFGRGFQPSAQPDQQQFRDQRGIWADHMVPLKEIVDRIDNRNIPPQLRQVPYTCLLTAVNAPAQLFPVNPARMSFIIGNISTLDTMYFSYGPPVSIGGTLVGLPIPAGGTYEESNGTISIDDIWVFWTTAGTLPVLGYEGLLAIESYK